MKNVISVLHARNVMVAITVPNALNVLAVDFVPTANIATKLMA